MDTITVILWLWIFLIVFAAGYISCITFLPKLYKLKEIKVTSKPFSIHFIFK